MRITKVIKMYLRSMTIFTHPETWYLSDIRRELDRTTTTMNVHCPSARNEILVLLI